MDSLFDWLNLPEETWRAWNQIWHLAIAFALAVPIGWDRERRDYSAGVRTFPIVSTASCVIMMLGISLADGHPEAKTRALYGVVTGMGFLGAGAIIKEQHHVWGLTTAASLWATAAIGLAVAADEFVLAITLALTNFVLLRAKRGNADPRQPRDPK
jgi:putative Mg2+ transporter-C (MgtC) family protein